MTPHQALERSIGELAEQGLRPPCSTNPEAWTGDDPDNYPQAIAICLTCPLLTPCSAAGVAEEFGVWGARLRAKTTRRKSAA